MNEKLNIAKKLMEEFAERTCIVGKDCKPVRYLWTDAFAVCNFLGLYKKTGDTKYREYALLLVDQVHHILGKHREDDERKGWISGLDEKEGEKHPTIGGLRIGKKNNERKKDEPYDERQEWDQDGQYYHYLTKWMHALDMVSITTGDQKYREWAIELALTAFDKFSYMTPANSKRMYWKMSIDLSYPLVPSMGQHDALDGYVSYLELRGNITSKEDLPWISRFDSDITDLYNMAQHINWESDDPLGMGGVLSDACMLAQLIVRDNKKELSDTLYRMLSQTLKGLENFVRSDNLRYPAKYRLAFREFGLSIGMHSISILKSILLESEGHFNDVIEIEKIVDKVLKYTPLADYIEKFWLDPENQKSDTWREHLDINSVMLATSLEPDGYLRIRSTLYK